MPRGGGPYTAECEALLQQLGAQGIVVIVAGGRRGDSFEVQLLNRALLGGLPAALRDLADSIDADLKALRDRDG